MNETLTLLSKVLPQLAIIAVVFGYIGWSVRGMSNKPVPSKAAKPAPASDKAPQDRAKNLEAALEKSKAAHKSMKAELETLQAASVPKATFERTAAELDAARKALDSETKRLSTLETDLKKSQDAIKSLNGRANDADKAQKDRSFTLENELSKAREQLAILQNRPDDSAGLHVEIERLRESVAVSTRFAGEMRKREAVAVEALEKSQAQLACLSDPSRPAAAISRKIGPVGDSNHIAAAKAEVIRLVEFNRQKEAELPVEEAPAVADEPPVLFSEAPAIIKETLVMTEEPPVMTEEPPVVSEKTPVMIEEKPATVKATPAPKRAPAHAELFSLD